MHEVESPYVPPLETDQQSLGLNSDAARLGISTTIFVGLPIAGGVTGFVGYLLAASILDTRDTSAEPYLSYGQQAALISLPMCTLTIAAIGLGLAFAVYGQFKISIILLLLVSLSVRTVNNSNWNYQIRTYGPDPSEAVLYYPPLACSGMALLTAVTIGAVAVLRKHKQLK